MRPRWFSMSEPQRVDGPLKKLARSLGLGSIQAGKIFTSWRQAVGDEVAARCRPAALRGGILEVVAVSPGWAAELKYLGPTMAARVNEFLGAKTVTRVEVRVGKVEAPTPPPTEAQTNDRLYASVGPTEKEVVEAESLAEEVGDPRLAEALKRAHLAGKMRSGKGPGSAILNGRERRPSDTSRRASPQAPKDE